MKAEEPHFLTIQNHKKITLSAIFFCFFFITVLSLTENTGISMKGKGQQSSTSVVRTILSSRKVGWSEK